ncbi:MAG: hypothetical protein PHQ80_00270 [Candidatus ainarchaeum sp.]|nr:hypothetical protein [Candidatus ainarchaeum sp.]MDD5096321.1 hypothetical protein [Candidatus ainarchaeum sp.]
MEEKLEEFEEIEENPKKGKPASGDSESAPTESVGARPDFRIVQTEMDKEGKTIYKNVGGMWKRTSKNGNVYYSMGIGKLRLLVFPNDRDGGSYGREDREEI